MTMTPKQKTAIREIDKRIRELRDAKHALLMGGVSGASLGSAGNSQSYTRIQAAEYDREIAALRRERATILRGSTSRRTSPDFSGV